MAKLKDPQRFQNLNYEKFRGLAADSSLSFYEKIGFPDSYRKGKERKIFHDVIGKLQLEKRKNLTIADIGCGCSELPLLLMNFATRQQDKLFMIDSPEMLDQLPDKKGIKKLPGYFPFMKEFLSAYHQRVDAVIIYSVLHYVYKEMKLFTFLDAAVSLLRPQGRLLIGDIPNISKRRRFFSSEQGIRYHQKFTRTKTLPDLSFQSAEKNEINDSVILSILRRYRSRGFDTYLLSQPEELSMSNRREDILIYRN